MNPIVNSNPTHCQPNEPIETARVKRVRCLFTEFCTIELFGNILVKNWKDIIDPLELGFTNIDGKNIGLYKNIGCINRNASKFIQFSKELLKTYV